jgi:hypothetical protein
MMYRRLRACLVAVLMVLTFLSRGTLYTESYVNPNVKNYSIVINNWFNWVLKIDINIPSILEVGSIALINVSIKVLEKGLGEHLSITLFSISIGRIKVSNYVGILREPGDNPYISLSIPIVVESRTSPGNITSTVMDISLEGYVEFVNGSRKHVSFSYSIPVLLFTPFSPIIAYINILNMDTGAVLQLRVDNYDPHPVYRVYISIYVNTSHYRTIYVESIPGNSSSMYSQFILLRPGIHNILVNITYITVFGILKSFTTGARVVIPIKPSIYIEVNTTSITLWQRVRIRGCVDPRVKLGLVIEYSLNGFEWISINNTETGNDGCFQIVWRPTLVSSTVYVRVRSIETELYRESVSNIVTISVSKIRPSIKIISNITSVGLGDYTKLLIVVDPPMSIPINIMYRDPDSSTWRTYVSERTDEKGRALIPTPFFSKPGTYIFKAVALETNITTVAESNDLAIYVSPPKEVSTQPSTTQIPGNRSRLDTLRIALVIGLGAGIALIMLVTGSRRRFS